MSAPNRLRSTCFTTSVAFMPSAEKRITCCVIEQLEMLAATVFAVLTLIRDVLFVFSTSKSQNDHTLYIRDGICLRFYLSYALESKKSRNNISTMCAKSVLGRMTKLRRRDY
jgi:hypothetical protein